MADIPAYERGDSLRRDHLGRQRIRRRLDKTAGLFVVSEKRLDFPPQLLIVFTVRVQKGRALAGREFQRGVVELFDLSPVFRVHNHLESSRSSQVLASRQSRATVSGETFKTSAVSSTLRPPKYLSSTTWHFLRSTVARLLSASSSATISATRSSETTAASSRETTTAAPPRLAA